MNTNNKKSLKRVIGIIVLLCVLWTVTVFVVKWSLTYMVLGFIAIISVFGRGGYEEIPIQHRGVKKAFGARNMKKEKQPNEGPFLTLPWEKLEIVSEQVWTHNVPPLEALTKKTEEEKAVEMITDVKVRGFISNPALYLNLKNPEIEIIELINSKCDEANFEYITDRPYSQCRKAKGEIQEEIKKEMTKIEDGIGIESTYGLRVLQIDVRTALPREALRKGLTEDKLQEIKVHRLTQSIKDLRQAAGKDEVDSKTLMKIAQVTLGIVKEDISKKEISFDFGHNTIEAGKNLAKILLNREGKSSKGDG